MGRQSGGLRVSRRNFRSIGRKYDNFFRRAYIVDGERREYSELPDSQQSQINDTLKRIQRDMLNNLQNKSVILNADGREIRVGFTRKGVFHAARDAIIILGGKYFSPEELVHIDQILARAEYVPTSHRLTKERKDNITMFFKYKDKTGKNVFFKVAYDPTAGGGINYYLYSIVDQ